MDDTITTAALFTVSHGSLTRFPQLRDLNNALEAQDLVISDSTGRVIHLGESTQVTGRTPVRGSTLAPRKRSGSGPWSTLRG